MNFNFFKKVVVTSGTFASTADCVIEFSTTGIQIFNEGSGGTNTIEFSLDGVNVHGELNPTLDTKTLKFDRRVVSKIYFRFKSGSSGSANVSVYGW